jgi:hypothetical protein
MIHRTWAGECNPLRLLSKYRRRHDFPWHPMPAHRSHPRTLGRTGQSRTFSVHAAKFRVSPLLGERNFIEKMHSYLYQRGTGHARKYFFQAGVILAPKPASLRPSPPGPSPRQAGPKERQRKKSGSVAPRVRWAIVRQTADAVPVILYGSPPDCDDWEAGRSPNSRSV